MVFYRRVILWLSLLALLQVWISEAAMVRGTSSSANRRQHRRAQYIPGGAAGAPPGSLASVGGSNGANVGSVLASSTLEECPTVEYTDVVIIGAGMAGIAAAARLQQLDPLLSYTILESTNRVGGRVRSTEFGIPGNTWTVEDGANWIYGNIQDNPLLTLVEDTQFNAPLNDFYDQIVYGPDGLPVDEDTLTTESERFMAAVEQAIADSDNQWTSDHELYNDPGVIALLALQGWVVGPDNSFISNLDYIIQWDYLDWEYAVGDFSVRWFPTSPYDGLFTADPRGFEFLLQTYFQQNVNTASLKTSTRVMSVSYDENIPEATTGKVYKARVHSNNGVECTDYVAQRVISTVSAGVLNADLIQFQPPLRFSEATHNPMKVGQYAKIFYQFPTQFWDNSAEYLRIVPDDFNKRGHCHSWANMAFDSLMPGSNMLRCEITTEAFEELLGGQRRLSTETINSLLDPLRRVYGAEVVGTPIATYATDLHNDANMGYGAYSHWKIGYSFTQYAQFYGGIEMLTPYCEHNGCNSLSEWILLFSGAATCHAQGETVHGAFYAGEKSANLVLRELGYDVDTDDSPCDVDWFFLA